jgi:hypothetical protein
VGQSFGFASELPLGPELAILPMKQREFVVNRVGQKADGGAEALGSHFWPCRFTVTNFFDLYFHHFHRFTKNHISLLQTLMPLFSQVGNIRPAD